MSLSLADLEKKFYEQQYAPRTSDDKVIARKNLVRNPKCAVDTTNIMQYNTNTIARVANLVDVPNGITTAVRSTINSGISNGGVWFDTLLTLDSSKTYTLSCYVRKMQGNLTPDLVLNGVIALGPVPGYTNGVWTRVSVTWTPTPDKNGMAIKPGVRIADTATVTEQFDVTGMLVEVSPTVETYFDGDSTDDNWTEYRWEGTPNDSASLAVEPEPVLSKNLLLDPYTFKVGTSNGGWYKSQDQGSDSPERTGDGSFILRNTAGDIGATWGYLRGEVDWTRIKKGARYVLSYEVRLISGTYNTNIATPIVQHGNSTNMAIGGASGVLLDTNGQWTLVRNESTAVADGISGNLFYVSIDNTREWELEFRNFQVSPVSLERTGPIPHMSLVRWLGLPHDSASVLIDAASRNRNHLELDFFRKNSGLENGSFADHEIAFYKTATGLTGGSYADLRRAWLLQETGLTEGTMADLEVAYYKTQLGL